MTVHGPHRNHRCRIREYLWRGYRCFSLENEAVRVVVCPDKGCDILECTHKPTDTECLYQSPWGLPSPLDRASSPLPEGAFRERFPGGWYLMLPNGPEPCTHRGASFGFHGEATFLSWQTDVITDNEEEIAVRCQTRLRRTPVAVARLFTLAAGAGTLRIEETIQNESPQQVEVLWGHHPTFGSPLLAPGTRVIAERSSGRWEARLPESEAKMHEFSRMDDLAVGWYAIVNETRDAAFSLQWDRTLFPVLGFWQLYGGGIDYPWYGSRYIAALEPCCDLPSLSKAAAAGTAIALAAGASRTTQLKANVFSPRQRPEGLHP